MINDYWLWGVGVMIKKKSQTVKELHDKKLILNNKNWFYV